MHVIDFSIEVDDELIEQMDIIARWFELHDPMQVIPMIFECGIENLLSEIPYEKED